MRLRRVFLRSVYVGYNYPCRYRSLRGGSWFEKASGCRSSIHDTDYPESYDNDLGIRLSRSRRKGEA
jgi:formylglycine-generating enzyme required for sulfatase activity